jgi:hypothetical protein
MTLVKSVYTTNITNKVLSALAAAGSIYTLVRNGTNIDYLSQARQNNLAREGRVDTYTTNTGYYDPEAPLLSEAANWWRLRGVDLKYNADSFNAGFKSFFYWLGDSWIPLGLLGGAVLGGFRHELTGTGKAFLKTAKRYLPENDWGQVIRNQFANVGKLMGHSAGVVSQGVSYAGDLGKKSPLATAIIAGLTFMTGSKFVSVLRGDSQQGELRDDLSKLY